MQVWQGQPSRKSAQQNALKRVRDPSREESLIAILGGDRPSKLRRAVLRSLNQLCTLPLSGLLTDLSHHHRRLQRHKCIKVF